MSTDGMNGDGPDRYGDRPARVPPSLQYLVGAAAALGFASGLIAIYSWIAELFAWFAR